MIPYAQVTPSERNVPAGDGGAGRPGDAGIRLQHLLWRRRMRIHMMAVGGTGMGALAGLLKAQGHDVTGCDTALYPPMSDAIRAYGIPVRSDGFDPSHLDANPDLVIIGNAVHESNPEARAAIDLGIEYLSMAEAIRRFSVIGRRSLVVAGTHGKTTTTALSGWLLSEAGLRPNVLVGGIVNDWDASFRWGGGEWTVLEGDEYETAFFDKGPKFLHYDPSTLILNNIELDHLDNFESLQELETAFVRLFGVVAEAGLILAGTESPSVARLVGFAGRRVQSFGLSGGEDWSAGDVAYTEEGTRFRLLFKKKNLGAFQTPLYGAHNLRNCIAALAACLEAGAELGLLQEALGSFPGVRRRQEIVYSGHGRVIVDDFAHHPTAIRETLKGLRQRFARHRIVACFEPRSFSCQTRLHEAALPEAFALADEVLLGPFNPSKKIPEEERLDLRKVAAAIRSSGKKASVMETPEAYMDHLEEVGDGPTLVAFFSSGPFFGLPARLAERLRD